MNILEEIAAKTRVRVAENQQKITLAQMKEQAQALNADTGFPMEQALKAEGISFICEVKKASPSKGLIAEPEPAAMRRLRLGLMMSGLARSAGVIE